LTCPFQTVVTFRYASFVWSTFPIRPKQPTTISRHHIRAQMTHFTSIIIIISDNHFHFTYLPTTTKLLFYECGTISAGILFSWQNTKYYRYLSIIFDSIEISNQKLRVLYIISSTIINDEYQMLIIPLILLSNFYYFNNLK